MSDTVEELDLLIEHRQRTASFLEAKAAAQAKGAGPDAHAAWREQKTAMRAWRQHWRGIREYLTPAGEGVAAPATVGLKSKGGK